MGAFEGETAIVSESDDRWRGHVHPHWSIAGKPNGGYLLAPMLRALSSLAGHADPLSVTAHFLRPGIPGTDCEIRGRSVRHGRRTGTASASLYQEDSERVVALATFGDLEEADGAVSIDLDAPRDLPRPESCVRSSDLARDVDLAITSRLEVRLHPDQTEPGASPVAQLDGWIRFCDGTPPSALALALLADAFPPSIYPKLGRVGWVPTLELTVQVRRRPVPGWIQGRFVVDDLVGSLLVESGTLWDADGRVVARSRQLGLVLES